MKQGVLFAPLLAFFFLMSLRAEDAPYLSFPLSHIAPGYTLKGGDKSFNDCDSQVIQKYGREFLLLTRKSAHGLFKDQYLFINGVIVQVKRFATDDNFSFEKLGDEFKDTQWTTIFWTEKIDEVENTEKFTAYYGESGGLLVIGKGENKGAMFYQKATMTFITEKWIRSQIALEKKKVLSDGLKAHPPGRVRVLPIQIQTSKPSDEP